MIRDNENINWQSGIDLRIAWKWLNHLGYKLKKVQKDIFFDRHEYKDLVEYKKSFLDKIKLLFLYLVEFSKDEFILPKEYPNNCAVNSSD